MSEDKAPDGIPLVTPSFAERDWERIRKLQRELSETQGLLDDARTRIEKHRTAVMGVVGFHVQMRKGTAGDSAQETLDGLLDSLVEASGPLDCELGFDRGLCAATAELTIALRTAEMMLVAERAAGQARVDYLSRECQRVASSIPGLNDVVRNERTESAGLRAELDAYRAAHDDLAARVESQ